MEVDPHDQEENKGEDSSSPSLSLVVDVSSRGQSEERGESEERGGGGGGVEGGVPPDAAAVVGQALSSTMMETEDVLVEEKESTAAGAAASEGSSAAAADGFGAASSASSVVTMDGGGGTLDSASASASASFAAASFAAAASESYAAGSSSQMFNILLQSYVTTSTMEQVVVTSAATPITTATWTKSQQQRASTSKVHHHHAHSSPSSSSSSSMRRKKHSKRSQPISAEVSVLSTKKTTPTSKKIWTYNAPFAQRMLLMFETGFKSDAVIILGKAGTKSTRTRIRVHKIFLALGSGLLPVLFTQSEFKNTLILEDIQEVEPFREYVRLLYGDSELVLANASESLRHALRFKSPEAAKVCLGQLEYRDDCVGLIVEALLLGMEFQQIGGGVLLGVVLGFIGRNALRLFVVEEFLDLSEKCMGVVISSDDLEVESEVDVFRFVLRWAKRQVSNELAAAGVADVVDHTPHPSEGVMQLLRQRMLPLLQYVRFPLMSVDTLIGEVLSTKAVDVTEISPVLSMRCVFEKQMIGVSEFGSGNNGGDNKTLAECNNTRFCCRERKWVKQHGQQQNEQGQQEEQQQDDHERMDVGSSVDPAAAGGSGSGQPDDGVGTGAVGGAEGTVQDETGVSVGGVGKSQEETPGGVVVADAAGGGNESRSTDRNNSSSEETDANV